MCKRAWGDARVRACNPVRVVNIRMPATASACFNICMPTADVTLAPVCAPILAAPPNEPTDLYLMGSTVDRVELSWRIPFNNGAGESEMRVCLALFRPYACHLAPYPACSPPCS